MKKFKNGVILGAIGYGVYYYLTKVDPAAGGRIRDAIKGI
jgi:hypothetical protein